jgi:adenylate cyclase class 1
MSTAVHLKDGIGRKELEQIRRRFTNLNKERLRRIEKELRPSQRDFIELLPLLFHINHPTLPGFCGSDTPAGVPDYAPSQNVLRMARKYSRSFEYKKRAQRRYHIQGIYLMGSMGSVAHSEQSDFDIWLCHDPDLSPAEFQLVCDKVAKLEAWADELGLEAHIFLMDVDAFRRGDRATISQESSGSTQHRLLLEEFYRTGILLAGRHPLWWLVPPDEEHNYSDYARMLLEKRFVGPSDCLDFGGLDEFPADEFFGAARWHLYKGIESPYKSVLKILLMEAYSQEYPRVYWLCQEAKEVVYSGEVELAELDPYVMLYRRLEKYLLERNEPERLALARRCFYFKTGLKLSREVKTPKGKWKRELLRTLTDEWGWGQVELALMDSRESWKIDRVMEERNVLVRELSRSYRLLTEFSREQELSGRIDPAELSLLGRKLYSALERRPGKIDRINPGISKDLVEERLSLHHVPRKNGDNGWLLYRGEVAELERDKLRPLKSTLGLVEMLAWCHLNGIASRDTLVSLYPQEGSVSQTEMVAVLDALRGLFPVEQKISVPLTQLAHPPHALSCALFVNVGKDPMAHLAKEGKQLASDRSDPFSFGATHSNLLLNLEQLMLTSWGELLAVRHEGKQGLLNSLCQYLQLAFQASPGMPPPILGGYGFSSVRASSIARRVEQLFLDVTHCFSAAGTGLDARYLLQIDDAYYLVQRGAEGFAWFEVGDRASLLEELAQPQSGYRPVVIDRMTLQGTPLPTLYQHNRQGVIQLFFHTFRGVTELFILDEQGALFTQRLQGSDEHHLLVQQQRFLDNLLYRRALLSDPATHLPADRPEFYKLSREQDNVWLVERHQAPMGRIPESYLELRLVCEGLDLSRGVFTLVCREREFSSLEFGDELYGAVADQVLALRSGQQRYPLYLTGVELSGPAPGQEGSTIEALQLKKRLEARLNQALNDRQDGDPSPVIFS